VESIGVPFKDLDSALIRRIMTMVNRTCRSRHELNEFADQGTHTPVVAFKVQGTTTSSIPEKRGAAGTGQVPDQGGVGPVRAGAVAASE